MDYFNIDEFYWDSHERLLSYRGIYHKPVRYEITIRGRIHDIAFVHRSRTRISEMTYRHRYALMYPSDIGKYLPCSLQVEIDTDIYI